MSGKREREKKRGKKLGGGFSFMHGPDGSVVIPVLLRPEHRKRLLALFSLEGVPDDERLLLPLLVARLAFAGEERAQELLLAARSSGCLTGDGAVDLEKLLSGVFGCVAAPRGVQ